MVVIESVCLFVVHAKAMVWIDAKRTGITKNDPEIARLSVLRKIS